MNTVAKTVDWIVAGVCLIIMLDAISQGSYFWAGVDFGLAILWIKND